MGHREQFLSPYYRRLLTRVREVEAMAFVDTDGDVTQTPPGVSLEQYRVYLRLPEEYSRSWASGAR